MSTEVSQDLCEQLTVVEKEAQSKLEDAKHSLNNRQKDNPGSRDQSELPKLMARLSSAQGDFAKAKAAASEHEQRFVARAVMHEVEGLMEQLTGWTWAWRFRIADSKAVRQGPHHSNPGVSRTISVSYFNHVSYYNHMIERAHDHLITMLIQDHLGIDLARSTANTDPLMVALQHRT